MGALTVSPDRFANEGQYAWHEFWVTFASFSFQMRFDVISVLFLVPLIFGLFIVSKNNKHANSISILITGILFTFFSP